MKILALILSFIPGLLWASDFPPLNCDTDETPAFIVQYSIDKQWGVLSLKGIDKPDLIAKRKQIITPALRKEEIDGKLYDFVRSRLPEQVVYSPFKQVRWQTIEGKIYTHDASKNIYSVRRASSRDKVELPWRLGTPEQVDPVGPEGRVKGVACEQIDPESAPGPVSRTGCDAYLYGWRTILDSEMRKAGELMSKLEVASIAHHCVKQAAVAVPEQYPWKQH